MRRNASEVRQDSRFRAFVYLDLQLRSGGTAERQVHWSPCLEVPGRQVRGSRPRRISIHYEQRESHASGLRSGKGVYGFASDLPTGFEQEIGKRSVFRTPEISSLTSHVVL